MSEYISREALLERIDDIWDCNDMYFEPNDKCCTVPDDCKGCKWAETKRAIRKIAENIPAADVRPMVRGHWYWDKDGMDWGIGAWKCSVCHSRNANVFGPETHPPMRCAGSKFCPNCGAEMEAGE